MICSNLGVFLQIHRLLQRKEDAELGICRPTKEAVSAFETIFSALPEHIQGEPHLGTDPTGSIHCYWCDDRDEVTLVTGKATYVYSNFSNSPLIRESSTESGYAEAISELKSGLMALKKP